MRLSQLLTALGNEIQGHCWKNIRDQMQCAVCMVPTGNGEAGFFAHVRNEAIPKLIHRLAQNQTGPEANNLLAAIQEEWDRHVRGLFRKDGKEFYGCVACKKEARTHPLFLQHVADSMGACLKAHAAQKQIRKKSSDTLF